MPDLYSFKLPEEREQFSKALLGIFIQSREISRSVTREEYDIRFDAFILAQAAQIGTRVLYCDDVTDALHRWSLDPIDGAKKWKQFSATIQALTEKRTRSVHELGGPGVEVMCLWPDRAPKELKELWRLLRKTKAAEKKWDHKLYLANAEHAIKQMSEVHYPYVKNNASSLLGLLAVCEDNFAAWMEERISHVQLANIWGAAAYAYESAESFRQALVALRKKRKAQLTQKPTRKPASLKVV